MRRVRSTVFALLLALCIVLGAQPNALIAANANVGYADFSFGSAIGVDPTADKPQSKLWFNAGRWWSVMFNTGSNTWHIYKLNWPSTWVDTGTTIDDRPTSRADALWDGSHLYIASLVRASSTNQGQFSRFSYNAAAQTYSRDTGFPVTIMTGSAETLAIDKDSTGQFWITYTQGKKVYVNRSTTSDAVWGTPFVVPGPTSATTLSSDDISSLVAYQDQNGSSVGVLWSNHNSPSSMYFAYHKDSAADTTWSSVETIYTATCAADDHINIKSLQSDSSGAIYAAVKTSFGDTGCGGDANSPLIRLVVRKPNNSWAVATFGTVGDDHTRPLVLLDTSNRTVYMFATSKTACGVIYMKSTSMDNLSFPAGKGTPFISSSTNTCINNATSTKQTVDASTGLVVMASDQKSFLYLHNAISLGSGPADTTPPTVTSKTPAANASGVDVATRVTATFSEAVVGVGSNSFTLTRAGGATVATSVTYDSATRTATLQPSTSLAPGTSYTAALTSGITDGANNVLAPTSWSFTTAAAPPSDTTPPTVVSTTPASSATSVNVASSVTVTFSEALDASTVTGANVRLSGPSGAVAASVTYEAASKTATLQPSASLAANSVYTAQISGIKDPAGNQLAGTYSWSFTTAAAAPPTTLTFGPSADTYVSQASSTTSFATAKSLQAVGGTSAKQIFIRFTVSGLPAGALVSSAKLRLYVTDHSPSGGIVQSVASTTWPEALTWTSKPMIGPVITTYANDAALDSTIEINLGSAISGNGTYSFAITLPTSNANNLGYASREAATVSNRPQLVITTN